MKRIKGKTEGKKATKNRNSIDLPMRKKEALESLNIFSCLFLSKENQGMRKMIPGKKMENTFEGKRRFNTRYGKNTSGRYDLGCFITDASNEHEFLNLAVASALAIVVVVAAAVIQVAKF